MYFKITGLKLKVASAQKHTNLNVFLKILFKIPLHTYDDCTIRIILLLFYNLLGVINGGSIIHHISKSLCLLGLSHIFPNLGENLNEFLFFQYMSFFFPMKVTLTFFFLIFSVSLL